MPFKGKVFPKARREFLDGVDFMWPSKLSSVETKMHKNSQMAFYSASLLRICGAGLLGRPREWLISGLELQQLELESGSTVFLKVARRYSDVTIRPWQSARE
jgi:hypothetical protein